MTKPEAYTFRGATFAETIRKVTRELGRDAVVLERRVLPPEKKRLRGLLGGGQEMIEIIAAPASTGTPPAPPPSVSPGAGRSILEKVYQTCTPDARAALGAAPDSGETRPSTPLPGGRPSEGGALSPGLFEERLLEVRDELRDAVAGELRSFLALQARGGQPIVGDALLATYRRLVENEVEAAIARPLVERLQAACGRAPGGVADETGLLLQAIGRGIRTSGPLRLRESGPTIVAVVGPTGVGKTTTLAKLAVEYGFRRSRRVGVLNEDLRRPAAEAQLRTLGQFLSAEVTTAGRPSEARAEIERMQGCDLVLVDTAGRVPGDGAAMETLRAYLEAIRPHETHCVLGAGSSAATAVDAVRRFREAGADRLVVSKIDEAIRFGLLLTLAAHGGLPLSYVTTGQEFVECIRPADGAELAPLVAGLADRLAPLAPAGAPETEAG